MIKLVKSSAKKLQPEQLHSIRENVKSAKPDSKEKAFSYLAKEKKDEDCPTPKQSSRIILRATKANNLVNTQPPLKKQRGSQDSHTIQALAKELRNKTGRQKLKVAKQKSLNQSHNVNSADHQPPLSLSQNENSIENFRIASSPKAFTLVKRQPETEAETVQKKYPSLRLQAKVTKQEREIAEIPPVESLELHKSDLRSDLIKHDTRLMTAKVQKTLSKTTRFPSGFAEAQGANMTIEIQADMSRDLSDFNKTQLVKFTGSGRTPGKELLKIVSPKKIDQNKGGIN